MAMVRWVKVLVGAILAAGTTARPTGAADDPKVAALAKEVHGKGWVVYGAPTPRGDMDLFLMRPDGTSIRRLTDTPEFNEGAPRFSPDGRKLMYRRISISVKIHHNRWGYQGHVVIANADGTDPVAICDDGGFPWAAWMPDGKSISCLTRKGIEIVDLATKQVTRRLPRKGIYQQLYGSPDGKWFCGVSSALGEEWTVVRMNAKTGEINAVHKKPTRDSQGDPARRTWGHGVAAECTPDWFPDSKHILFSHNPPVREGERWTQLWMASGDGSSSRLVFGEEGRHIYGGTVSHDGKYVLFTRVRVDGAGGLASPDAMGLVRFEDTPIITPESKDMRERQPNAKGGPILTLPVGFEPDWIEAEIPPAKAE